MTEEHTSILPPPDELDHRESLTSLLASEARERARLASKPDLSLLDDAVELDDEGVPIFTVAPGDKVVIERYATILRGSPWLDTKVYTVESIDGVTGTLYLWDDDDKGHAMTNYITGVAAGFKFKVPPAKGGGFTSQRKRGRPKKLTQPGAPEPTADGPKRGRGRPPGTKNRPRDVIAAEKRAAADERRAKVGERKGRGG